MESAEVRRLLEETHALLNGHFLLASGKHSDKYFQCARVLASPARASLLGAGIGGKWADESIDAVFGPAIGGIVIAHEVARYLGSPAYYTEREEGKMRLPGFSNGLPALHCGQAATSHASVGIVSSGRNLSSPKGLAGFAGAAPAVSGERQTIEETPTTSRPSSFRRSTTSCAEPPVVTTSSTTSARDPGSSAKPRRSFIFPSSRSV